ncbi:ankyrin repeat-containing domain protein [Phyllosticta citribraziliensis]|uniref:Ankyrin repeat-containing domain protein n=1 Tax=Phyllosticta citribraziliensis TaxID=989973 RepID=A0ABR1LPA4_9PEZI
MPDTPEDPPPAKRLKNSPDTEDGHKDALIAVEVKKGSPLTSLAPELFKMIMDRTVDPDDHQSFKNMVAKRSVSRLFNAEILDLVIRNRDQPGTVRYWSSHGHSFLKIALLENRFLAEPNDQKLLLATIHHVVTEITDLQGDRSERNRRKWTRHACSCIARFRHTNPVSSLRVMVDNTEDGQTTFREEDVRRSCWAVVAWSGDVTLLEKLKSATGGAAPKNRSECPRFMGSAQWTASRRGHIPVIRYLQLEGYDFGQWEHNKPLEATVHSRNLEAFELLLTRSGDEVAEEFRAVGHILITSGWTRWARLFWAENRSYNQTPANTSHLMILCLAGEHNHAEMTKLLIDAGAEPNVYCRTWCEYPFRTAVRVGPPELVRALIENGASPQRGNLGDESFDPLRTAIDFRKQGIVELLLEYGSWQTLTKTNALLAAVIAGPPELRPGKDHPSRPGHIGILKVLLQGFDPNSSKRAKNLGREAVARARQDGKSEMLAMLLEHGCELEPEPEAGKKTRRRRKKK